MFAGFWTHSPYELPLSLLYRLYKWGSSFKRIGHGHSEGTCFSDQRPVLYMNKERRRGHSWFYNPALCTFTAEIQRAEATTRSLQFYELSWISLRSFRKRVLQPSPIYLPEQDGEQGPWSSRSLCVSLVRSSIQGGQELIYYWVLFRETEIFLLWKFSNIYKTNSHMTFLQIQHYHHLPLLLHLSFSSFFFPPLFWLFFFPPSFLPPSFLLYSIVKQISHIMLFYPYMSE